MTKEYEEKLVQLAREVHEMIDHIYEVDVNKSELAGKLIKEKIAYLLGYILALEELKGKE